MTPYTCEVMGVGKRYVLDVAPGICVLGQTKEQCIRNALRYLSV